MKTKLLSKSLLASFAVIALACPGASAATLDIESWYDSVVATTGNVVAATSGSGGGQTGGTGSGWTFDGTIDSMVSFDFGNLGSSSEYHTVSLEFVINCTSVTSPSTIAQINGYGGYEANLYKWPQRGSADVGMAIYDMDEDWWQYYTKSTFVGATAATGEAHVVITTDATGAVTKLYINGTQAGDILDRINLVVAGGAGFLGGGLGDEPGSPNYVDFFEGSISGVATYTTELTAEQVAANYNALTQIPEPSTYALLGVGVVAGLALLRRRKGR